jgi:hypothetical protein
MPSWYGASINAGTTLPFVLPLSQGNRMEEFNMHRIQPSAGLL